MEGSKDVKKDGGKDEKKRMEGREDETEGKPEEGQYGITKRGVRVIG